MRLGVAMSNTSPAGAKRMRSSASGALLREKSFTVINIYFDAMTSVRKSILQIVQDGALTEFDRRF